MPTYSDAVQIARTYFNVISAPSGLSPSRRFFSPLFPMRSSQGILDLSSTFQPISHLTTLHIFPNPHQTEFGLVVSQIFGNSECISRHHGRRSCLDAGRRLSGASCKDLYETFQRLIRAVAEQPVREHHVEVLKARGNEGIAEEHGDAAEMEIIRLQRDLVMESLAAVTAHLLSNRLGEDLRSDDVRRKYIIGH